MCIICLLFIIYVYMCCNMDQVSEIKLFLLLLLYYYKASKCAQSMIKTQMKKTVSDTR